ncbi:hypothetical protein [Siphonobacter sp. SORGH_AS_0500]|uniref:hypothetical protein n=1 Tax=Siphonobacter sp. SORGH_AS_0500 TaxID=1864824 RepID=UPI0028676623|nr:hypothetical protein [Siphonobacter sp. SORGH_AS_0500]MDR6195926.1 hypothetical protein [Siphonobacter sp. SORGH_AS_0500]
MMQTPTKRFQSYLTPILESIPDVQKVGMSDGARIDRFLAASVSEAVYPGIFFIRPKYVGYDVRSGILYHRFHTILYVFTKADQNDDDGQDEAFMNSEWIATQAVEKIFQDSLTYKCLFDFNDYQAEPIDYVTTDAAYGYEVKLVIGIQVNDIYYP